MDERVRQAWEEELQARQALHEESSLPPPPRVELRSGRGQVTLNWEEVPGASGYLIYRAEAQEGPYRPLDHGGGDVLAVPKPPYADTTGVLGAQYWYRVAALPFKEASPGLLSAPLEGRSDHRAAPPLELEVDAEGVASRLERPWRMLGSEHLSLLENRDQVGPETLGEGLEAALRLARKELGVRYLRAHGILDDDLGVYREEGGHPAIDFSGVARIYDRLLALGLRPVVELSFTPQALARQPGKQVFSYGAWVSPPKDLGRWSALLEALARFLIDRYGREEVREWGFEVWNEANIPPFWTEDREAYFELYRVSAEALKRVDPHLKVGGPATAAAEWIEAFCAFVAREGLPLDFLSTHTYGNLPLALRPSLLRHRLSAELWWTEWGVTPTHFHPVNDLPFGAPFVLHGMRSVQGRASWLAYWVVSDHFEELGRPPSLFHGGFGLLTVGGLRKPRFWALRLAEELADTLLPLSLRGDGAESLVGAWASRHPEGHLDLLAWNGTLDQGKISGHPLLDRQLQVRFRGLEAPRYRAWLTRVDQAHGHPLARWRALHPGRLPQWPSEEEWAILRKEDRLEPVDLGWVSPRGGTAEFLLDLPMPGVFRLRLEPA
jgi:xylan 1,4-beta-xylosidase